MSQVTRQSSTPDSASSPRSHPITAVLKTLLLLCFLTLAVWSVVFAFKSSDRLQSFCFRYGQTTLDHGSNLGETLENIRDEEYEIFTAFDADGRKLFEHTSDSTLMVEVPARLQEIFLTQGGCIIAHNHPGADAPFSGADLALSASLNVQESIVVSTHYVYTIRPASTGWPSADTIKDWFRDLYRRYPNDEELWLFVSIYDDDADDYFTGICATDYLMELYVQEFGGTYTKSAVSITNQTMVDPPRD